MRYLILSLALISFGCTEEQSRSIGSAPKKTVDRVTTDVNKAMQQGQGSERLKEEEQK